MNFKLMEDLAKYLASKAPDLVDSIQSYITDRADVLGKIGESNLDAMSQMALNELREYARTSDRGIQDIPEDATPQQRREMPSEDVDPSKIEWASDRRIRRISRNLPPLSDVPETTSREVQDVVEGPPPQQRRLPNISDVIQKGKDVVKTGVDVGKRAMRVYELGEELAWGRLSLDEYARQMRELNPKGWPDIDELEKKKGRRLTAAERSWVTPLDETTIEQKAVEKEKKKRPAHEYGKPTLAEEEAYYAGTGRYPYKRRGKEGELITGTEDIDFLDREHKITEVLESLEEDNLEWGRGGRLYNPYIDKEYSNSQLNKWRNALEDWHMWTLDDSDQVDRGIEPSKRLMTAFNGFDEEGNAKFKKTSSIEEYNKSFTDFENLRHEELGQFLGLGDSPEQERRQEVIEADYRDSVLHKGRGEVGELEYDIDKRGEQSSRDFLRGEGKEQHLWDRDSLLGTDTIDTSERLTDKGYDIAMNNPSFRSWLRLREPREGAKEFQKTNAAWERLNGWGEKNFGHPFFVMPKNNNNVALRLNNAEQVGRLAEVAADVALNYITEGVIFGDQGAIPYITGETIRGALRTIEKEYQQRGMTSSSKERALVVSEAPHLSQIPIVLSTLLKNPGLVAKDLIEALWESEQGQEGSKAGANEIKELFGTLGENYVNAKSYQIEKRANRQMAEMLKKWLKYELPQVSDKLWDKAFSDFFDDTTPRPQEYPTHNRWIQRR